MKETGQKTERLAQPQLRVLRAIRDYIKKHGTSPSYADIAASVDRGETVVRRTIDRLIAKGMLVKAPGYFRNLVITEAGSAAASNGRRKSRRTL